MYLHLGVDYMVKNSQIIAIFNLNHPQSQVYNEYVKKYGSHYQIVDASGGEGYYSCVLTNDTMYLSSISSITLKKRAESGFLDGAVYTNLETLRRR